jgi:pyruvate/2-oxoglutarate/acetoin dehydrogenase E1 component
VGAILNYAEELTKAMKWLAEKPATIFLGQNIIYGGNAIYSTLGNVPLSQRTELGVMEDCQMGMSIGLSIVGRTVISIYPRMNFLMCAMNQLVNHLDKMEVYSNGEFKPKVIIRVCVGSEKPMYPGVQHSGDYPIYIENINIVRLYNANEILPAYQEAYESKWSTLLIEYGDLYNT